MCGIVGIIGEDNAVPAVLASLKRLEYRGYDSAGLAVIKGKRIDRRRAVGGVGALNSFLAKKPLVGSCAIGHVRWATHGLVNVENAHPHVMGPVAVVHNGIIENFVELRRRLIKKKVAFKTDTDTEVVAALIAQRLKQGMPSHQAVSHTLRDLEGAFALGILIAGEPDKIFSARRGSPLVVGFGKSAAVVSSDTAAMGGMAEKVCYLEEGDFATVTRHDIKVVDGHGREVKRPLVELSRRSEIANKGNHRFFMEKEILEQPAVVADSLSVYTDPLAGTLRFPNFTFDFKNITKINLVACGSSYYAALVARHWFENLARLPAEADIASEFRYREAVIDKRHLNFFISQSGETLDTLSALRHCHKRRLKTAALVNVSDSSMARESQNVLFTHAGDEIAVASTKSFVCQLIMLLLLAVNAAHSRGQLMSKKQQALLKTLISLPKRLADIISHDKKIARLSKILASSKNVLYIARGDLYPVALEGALKFKEITYHHAEGYPAGEMKHGPIALIEKGLVVVALAPSYGFHAKTFSNLAEASARGARVILVSDKRGIQRAGSIAEAHIEMPEATEPYFPILYALPVQLLAYHAATLLGHDVDRPRNLAKSVTVE